MADGHTNTQEAPIELMALSDAYETIAFVAFNEMRSKKTSAHYLRIAQQNAETANQANKAADSLAKQLKEAQEKIVTLTPPPAAEPAPGPDESKAPEAAQGTKADAPPTKLGNRPDPIPAAFAQATPLPKADKSPVAAAAAEAVAS